MPETSEIPFEERRVTAQMGMWVFLAGELMFFGGLFAAYFVYRFLYPAGFAAGGRESYVVLGATNTAILLSSSYCITIAVAAVKTDDKLRTIRWLALAVFLGAIFLCVKAYEYWGHIREGLYPGGVFLPGRSVPQGTEMFYSLYFAMTGLHAVHLLVGLGLVAWIVLIVWRARQASESTLRLDIVALYWHFVDVIWLFLFPLFYLVGRHA